MDNDINDWLEQEYKNFEEQFFPRVKVWRSPVHTLKGTQLYALFESFSRSFPDHPSEINTVFYLTESADGAQHQVWLWCSHFEHALLEDLRNLVLFMDEASQVLSTSQTCTVEMLDNIREKLVLEFFCAPESAVELLKCRGIRVGGP